MVGLEVTAPTVGTSKPEARAVQGNPIASAPTTRPPRTARGARGRVSGGDVRRGTTTPQATANGASLSAASERLQITRCHGAFHGGPRAPATSGDEVRALSFPALAHGGVLGGSSWVAFNFLLWRELGGRAGGEIDHVVGERLAFGARGTWGASRREQGRAKVGAGPTMRSHVGRAYGGLPWES